MHGLKIDDKAVPDEISKDDLPYMEMIYRLFLVKDHTTTYLQQDT